MKIYKTRTVKTPQRGTSRSAGLDFFVPDDFKHVWLDLGEAVNIPSGIKAKVPEGYMLIAQNKSGVAVKKGLQVGACVIDEDYQGEIHLHVRNISNKIQVISPGEKLVQMVLVPVSYEDVEIVSSLKELYEGKVSERGSGGFGSTGTK